MTTRIDVLIVKKAIIIAIKIDILFFVLGTLFPLVPPFWMWLYAVFVVSAHVLIVQE